MRVRVLYFGMLRDIAGRGSEEIEVEAGATAGEVFDRAAERYPKLGEHAGSIVIARNQEFAGRGDGVAEGDEIALLPPVSGGSSPYLEAIEDAEGHFFALTRLPIDVEDLRRRLLRGEDGAMVDFQGVTRNNTEGRAVRYLDYEGYEAMAVKVMAGIGREIAASHEIGRIGMVHRLGRLEIGEASVAVVVCAPHRKPAFSAALEGINRLKKLAPIWKKEYFADGDVWVDGDWDESVLRR